MPPRSEGAQSEDPYLARYDGCEMTPAKLVKALNTLHRRQTTRRWCGPCPKWARARSCVRRPGSRRPPSLLIGRISFLTSTERACGAINSAQDFLVPHDNG